MPHRVSVPGNPSKGTALGSDQVFGRHKTKTPKEEPNQTAPDTRDPSEPNDGP